MTREARRRLWTRASTRFMGTSLARAKRVHLAANTSAARATEIPKQRELNASRPQGFPTLSDFAAPFECAPKRHFVRVIEIAANRESGRDARHAHTERMQQPGNVHRGRFTLDGR